MTTFVDRVTLHASAEKAEFDKKSGDKFKSIVEETKKRMETE